MRKPAKNPRLVDRDYDILEHLMRYRMTTREVLHQLFFPESEINAVTKVTSRLVRHKFLSKFELLPSHSYFVIGPEAAKVLGVSPNKCKAIGPQALLREYGTLLFCCKGEPARERLRVSEIRHKQPDLLHRGIDSSHYYLDNDGETVRLAYIRVDHGGQPDHIARKCEEDISRRSSIPALASMIDADRFMIAIVTGHANKAEDIRECFRRRKWPVFFRVEVVEELAQLISRPTGF